jgi:hypothetical protein
MITSFVTRAVVAATISAVGGLGAVAVSPPARAGTFSAGLLCNVPMLGARSAVLDGWLTSPGRTVVGGTTDFQLHISGLSLASPVPIDSWSASAWIDVGGTESTNFQMTGSGGYVAAGQPLTGDLTGTWTPSVRGPHTMSLSGITISADTATAGSVTVQCTAAGPRPVAEALAVIPYYSGWTRPVLPPYSGEWSAPIVVRPYRPYRPGWPRPVPPPHHGGWHHGGPHHQHGGH